MLLCETSYWKTLPEPAVLARQAIEELEGALEELRGILVELGEEVEEVEA